MFKDIKIPTYDFWDKLLFKHYGRCYVSYDHAEGVDYTVIMWHYDGKYYLEEIQEKHNDNED